MKRDTTARDQDIIRRYRLGENIREIAERHDIAVSKVWRAVANSWGAEAARQRTRADEAENRLHEALHRPQRHIWTPEETAHIVAIIREPSMARRFEMLEAGPQGQMPPVRVIDLRGAAERDVEPRQA